MKDAIATVRQFAACINARDLAGITSLMTEDHQFIDAAGGVYAGRDTMSAGWRQFLELFPDYRIEIDEIQASGDTVAAFGYAAGGGLEKPWRIPAAWRAVVRDGHIAEWRVYADIEPMMRSIGVTREF